MKESASVWSKLLDKQLCAKGEKMEENTNTMKNR